MAAKAEMVGHALLPAPGFLNDVAPPGNQAGTEKTNLSLQHREFLL